MVILTPRGRGTFLIGNEELYYSKNVQKAKGYATMVPSPGAYNIFTAIDKSLHRHKHRVLSQGFSDRCLRDFEPTILKEIDVFVGKFDQENWSAPADMTKCCRYLAYDIMGDFGFGQSFNLQEKTDNRFLMDAVLATSRKAAVIMHYPALANLRLEKLLARRMLKMRENYLKLMSYLVKNRMEANQNHHNDLFSYLVEAKDPETGEGFTESELWAESRFLLIAGKNPIEIRPRSHIRKFNKSQGPIQHPLPCRLAFSISRPIQPVIINWLQRSGAHSLPARRFDPAPSYRNAFISAHASMKR